METKNAIFCDHANEVPVCCPCGPDCYCKDNTCKPREKTIVPPPPNSPEPDEIFEEAVAQMRTWLSEIYPASKVDRAMGSPSNKRFFISSKIWTYNNAYSIIAKGQNALNEWYLGASAHSRKSRTGETWQRGNNLADGRFCEETWRRIMTDIVRYEAEEVKSEKWKEPHIITPKI